MSGAKEKLVAFVMSGILHVKMSGALTDLATYLGVNRCALSRVIGQLSADGKIRCSRNVITIL